ncbi:MAG: glycerophosphodiester phosphodiesterase [Ruminococcaceae bacterium]|nr:glycerophosphodiester phosphodiesterase [Oscillospiraceae bacterium]
MKTKIWAHRGASVAAPENTLAAFDLAVQQGADGIELDVHFSADGVVVVTHDETCLRVTGEQGHVNQLTLSQLRQLDFSRILPGFSRQQIPTLAEVFDLIQPTSLVINIELKNSITLYPGLEQAVLDLACTHHMSERICLSSFIHYSLVQAALLAQERKLHVPCGLLYSCALYEPWMYARHVGAQALHPHYANLRIPGFVDACHEAGIQVNVWTIDDPDHLRMAFQLAPDAVITDVPDQAIALYKAVAGQS